MGFSPDGDLRPVFKIFSRVHIIQLCKTLPVKNNIAVVLALALNGSRTKSFSPITGFRINLSCALLSMEGLCVL